ncbi:acetamidase/formamidase family protein [Singulisphaera acidiphila]|uniref:Putative acetamidase/formamidase n=1 Tax=Singulisphaera acidiphila (strain ATCC BAA-1392 / DSM 18658 / VKM B-2454 / MOB10) TaxID=886293 RepID=L0DDK2_SINAD|nr:acetamidase/formamidase family protein [Singulisphaera acidiphila]AGA26751.1 putative acetamidase/formamidase [Singulisphaera acidiphila DSM 18658]
MKRLPIGPLYYEFSRHHEPRLRIEPGETVMVASEDALSGQIRSNTDRRDKIKMPYSNPLTGPIAVEGAEPGDALAVTIQEIRPTIGECATRTADPKQLCEWLGTDCPHGTHVCPIRDGLIYWSDSVTIPYTPMLGCIGTAPDWGCPTTAPAGPHGGNMDIIETCPGNTVYLPVFIPGGFLYLGDAHAAMGHGELSATGLEMPAETTITVNLLKGKRLTWPRIESPTEIMTIVSGAPMERSIAQAYALLSLWMETEHGWNRWRAYDLLTHVGQISVGYYGIGTVAAKVDKRYLHGR